MKIKNTPVAAPIATLILTVSLIGGANAATVFEDNFDPITASNWTLSGASAQGDGNAEFLDGNALRFFGGTTRSAQTIALDLSSDGEISFNLKFGGPNDTSLFEDADPGEDVNLNYSTDGGNSWMSLQVFDTEDVLFRDTWGAVTISVDGVISSPSTMFQWIQPTFNGSSFDHWAIDNVLITSNASAAVPEPSSAALLGLGSLALLLRRQRS